MFINNIDLSILIEPYILFVGVFYLQIHNAEFVCKLSDSEQETATRKCDDTRINVCPSVTSFNDGDIAWSDADVALGHDDAAGAPGHDDDEVTRRSTRTSRSCCGRRTPTRTSPGWRRRSTRPCSGTRCSCRRGGTPSLVRTRTRRSATRCCSGPRRRRPWARMFT